MNMTREMLVPGAVFIVENRNHYKWKYTVTRVEDRVVYYTRYTFDTGKKHLATLSVNSFLDCFSDYDFVEEG